MSRETGSRTARRSRIRVMRSVVSDMASIVKVPARGARPGREAGAGPGRDASGLGRGVGAVVGLDVLAQPDGLADDEDDHQAGLAKDTGLGRESLYKALAPGAKPRYDTVLKLMRALGVQLHAIPAHK